jgi:hypothetical protein
MNFKLGKSCSLESLSAAAMARFPPALSPKQKEFLLNKILQFLKYLLKHFKDYICLLLQTPLKFWKGERGQKQTKQQHKNMTIAYTMFLI